VVRFFRGALQVALGVIFGLNYWIGALYIFIIASLGGFCRRYLAKISSNLFVQPFYAALIAGLLGAILMHHNNALYLIAVCPCMVLIPGPHFLNGFLDLIRARMDLGFCRIIYATLVCLAIITGLLIGLSVLGGTLSVAAKSTVLAPLSSDIIAACFAVMSYCIFFSMPLKLIFLPALVGMIAHALRWEAIANFDFSVVGGTFLAGLFVGVILTWISHRKYLPFAAGGFAAVVSMIPGVYLFRMASGFIQLTQNNQVTFVLLSDTLYQGIMSMLIFLAIGIGLLVPRIFMDDILKIFKSE